MDVYDYWKFDLSVVTIRDNVIADSIVMRRPAPRGADKYYLNIDARSGYQHIPITDPGIRKELSGNVFVEGNPGILDFRTFRLSKDCPAWKLGFKPIPFDSIGLVRDEYRKLLRRRPSGDRWGNVAIKGRRRWFDREERVRGDAGRNRECRARGERSLSSPCTTPPGRQPFGFGDADNRSGPML